MPITVLLADSNVMSAAILNLPQQDSQIDLLGQTASLPETLDQCAATNLDVLLINPHMADECEYPPEFFKSQISKHARNTIAMSSWNDAKPNCSPKILGARILLDKSKLFADLIPCIERCRSFYS